MSYQSSAQRLAIELALDRKGVKYDQIVWKPIRSGSEMEGPIGGWEVLNSGSIVAWGYNARSVVAAIESPDGMSHDNGYGVFHGNDA